MKPLDHNWESLGSIFDRLVKQIEPKREPTPKEKQPEKQKGEAA